ncbi:MAG: radical SAM protein [Infirmifilum sp.]
MTHLRELIYGRASEADRVVRRARSTSGVGSIVWLFTYRCNLGCAHCQAAGGGSEELSTEEALRVIGKLEEAGRPLVFVSGGEPLLRGDAVFLLEELKARGFRVILSTNGTLIDGSNAERIAGAVSNVALPVYGPPEVHDAYTRVRGSHEKVINSLRLLKGSTGLTLRTVASRTTLRHLDYVLDLASRYDVGTLYISDLPPLGGVKGELLSVAEWRELVDRLLKVLPEVGFEVDIGLHPSAGVYAMLKSGYTVQEIRERLRGYRLAREGLGFLALAPNGDVLVSNYAPVKIGNLLRDSLASVLKHELYLKLGSPEVLRSRCPGCPLVEVCGGSRAKAYYYTGDVLGEDPTCMVRDILTSTRGLS